MPETILTEALVTLEEAKTYLIRTGDAVDDEVLTRLINYVTGQAESASFTNRRLKSRTYTGATALVVDGHGDGEVYAPEYPVTALTSIEELSSTGTVARTLNIAGARLDSAGLIYLPNDSLLEGVQNHLITCTAGIVSTTAQWKALTGAALRWVQVAFLDQQNKLARGTSISVGGETMTVFDTACPKDVERVLRAFARVL